MVSLMFWSGCRRSEVARADLDRLDLANGRLEVLGKSGKWRTVPLTVETQALLERYLRRRRNDPSPALFASARNTGDGRLAAQAITLMLNRRRAKTGVMVTTHQFRRAMAINAADRGMSDLSICTIAGWDDPRMLKTYRRAALTRQAAADFAANDPTAAKPRRRLRAV
jgi:integrase